MTNPPDMTRAIALEYGDQGAPRVIAQAEGELARLMAEAARDLGIPAIKDEHLAQVLSRLRLNEEIPEDLYVSVAVVMAWAYWLSGRAPAGGQPRD
jgi:flagellar biosynthesis protein